jgi:(S)-ureidoglycine aminohydrolase
VHNLGETRSTRQADHCLLTPDTFIRAPLPGMKNSTAVVHVSPAMGAQFTQYTAEFEANGELGDCDGQRFLYVLNGTITAAAEGDSETLEAGGFAFFPEGSAHKISAETQSRVAVIEKRYRPLRSAAPPNRIVSAEDRVEANPLEGDPELRVRCLLPDTPGFDFAVNVMIYQPGAALNKVEMHVMEHGLLMLEGGGIYRLGDRWYPVMAGDFIWMAPWCPQWFGAIGKIPAKYLIYKDWNRHPLGVTGR